MRPFGLGAHQTSQIPAKGPDSAFSKQPLQNAFGWKVQIAAAVGAPQNRSTGATLLIRFS
jgi:hypothetical protein